MDKTINTSSSAFQSNISQGLLLAYKEAFAKMQNLYTKQSSQRSVITKLSFDPNQLKVELLSALANGQSNADKTKNQIELRYYLVDGATNQPISGVLASDAINLLNEQDMARYLNYEVVQQGYVEAMPRLGTGSSDQKLWVIAAVLGPLAVLFFVFWIIFWVYYKFINTSRGRMQSKSKARIINNESPDSVSQ